MAKAGKAMNDVEPLSTLPLTPAGPLGEGEADLPQGDDPLSGPR